MHDCDRERDLLDRLVLDGEFLELDDGTIVPPDGFTPIMAGPKWNREVVGYRLGSGSRARTAGLRYVGDRPMGASRALPWIAPALPPGGWPAQRPDRSRARARHHGEDRQRRQQRAPRQNHRGRLACGSGLVDQVGTGGSRASADQLDDIGSVPYLRIGEEVKRIQTGPDEVSRKYESQLEKDVSSALNMPLSELLSDTARAAFEISAWHGKTPSAKSPAAADGGTAATACPCISKSCPTPSRRADSRA